MKNAILKISKIISTFVMAILFIFADTQSVDAAASSIKIGKATLLPGYIAGVKYNIKPVVGGGYAYCLDIKKSTASNVTQYYVGEMDAGIAYIMEHGYPNKKFTGDKKKDFYITQGAIWWYLDETAGTSNLGNGYKKTGSDSYKIRKYVKNLVKGAKKAKKKGYSKPSLNAKVSDTNMTLSADGKYFVSKAINANAKNITGKYTVKLSKAPAGSIVTNTNGKSQTKFAAGENFLIKIPANKVNAGASVTATAKITASSTINKAYKYAPKNNSIQPMTVLQKYTKDVKDTIKVTATKKLNPSKVTIQKLDKETQKPVSGAVLAIKDSKGKEIKNITTTDKAIVIDNLANGTYSVVEKKAPNGYKLSTEVAKFTIDNNNRSILVKYYNEKQHNVCSYDSETNKYYDIKGNVTTKDKYIEECESSSVVIRKLDKETNTKVSGAKLVVKDSKGNVIKSFVTSENDEVISKLANGVYTVEEVEAPEGYELSTEKETFTISNTVRNVEVKFYNVKKHNVCSYDDSTDKYYDKDGKETTKETYIKQCSESEVTIYKLDKNTENPIAGAVLVIKDSMGNTIKEFTSTANGYSITGLSNGTYTVEEKQAPEGYELSTEKETFTLSDDVKTVEVKFYNIPKDRVVTITKVDSTTGKMVAGAVIVVRNSLGEEVARFTSTNEAYIIKDIEDGVYTVEEEEAPEGYFLNEEVQTFTIDSTHLSYQVTIKDIPRTCDNGGKDADECMVEVPNTGSSSTPFYIIGIAIISTGLGYVYKRSKKAY